MKNDQEKQKASIRILVVDDEEAIRDVFYTAISHSGYKCYVAASGVEALSLMEHQAIDVVISDIQMPGMSGIDLVKKIRETYDSDVIVITGFVENYTYEKIIQLGARDFIHKPVRLQELLVRLKRVLNERALLAERNLAYDELKQAYLDTINRLAMAAEFKDEDTGDHILRISGFSALMAEKYGLSSDEVQTIRYSSPMHDVGKIGIPDSILLKKGMLTPEEFDIMKTHTSIGGRILADSKSKILETAEMIALSHHEKWNGEGYPEGLAGEDIPVSGRIVGLVDAFDALTSRRPYKDPYPVDVACKIIQNERGKHFDPDLTDIFLNNIHNFLNIRKEIGEMDEVVLGHFKWSERDKNAVTQF
jgi:putative two-component system response regulator